MSLFFSLYFYLFLFTKLLLSLFLSTPNTLSTPLTDTDSSSSACIPLKTSVLLLRLVLLLYLLMADLMFLFMISCYSTLILYHRRYSPFPFHKFYFIVIIVFPGYPNIGPSPQCYIYSYYISPLSCYPFCAL